jgi:hypothetical protein
MLIYAGCYLGGSLGLLLGFFMFRTEKARA